MGRLTGMRPLNLYKGDHTDPNYVLPGLIFDNDELFDSVDAAFQVVSCEVSGRPHGKLLHSLQVGERRAFFIEDALAIPPRREEVGLHLARSQYLTLSGPSLTYLRGDVCTRPAGTCRPISPHRSSSTEFATRRRTKA